MNARAVLPTVNGHLDEGDYSSACRVLQEALAAQPDFFLYHERLAEIARQQGDYKTARAAYTKALTLYPAATWIEAKLADLDGIRARAGFVGKYDRYPDLTGRRQAEGGARMRGLLKSSQPDLPLVTIVTAVYDNDTTFQRCIDSIKAQTYRNIEYIVVDGGSPQSTVDIIRTNDDFIDYYISEPDRGIYSAMNKGIALARGDYICLLNSDDYYDPKFVALTVALARERGVDIVYTDYEQGDNYMAAQPIGAGVLLGHLNICHNTFLASRESYNRIGPYDEEFRIVSDAVWIRNAFQADVSFACCSEKLFTLTEGGMSSGNTEARRQLFINEVIESYLRVFPQLSPEEAEQIYMFRFNKTRARAVINAALPHIGDETFRIALRDYVQYCLGERKNFQLHHSESESTFVAFVDLCELVGADKKCIHINTKHGMLSDILAQIDALVARRKVSAKTMLLHFVTVFSAPSETFIYDLLGKLEASEDIDNFVLYEHAKLPAERPYDKKLQVSWRDHRVQVAEQIYKYFINALRPDVVIAHFAINEHRFHERTAPVGIRIPTVVMTHGIDVFNLKIEGDYSSHVLRTLAPRHDVAFTAVSEYLQRELLAAGVDSHKVMVLPNTVNDRFFAHRKTSGFYDGTRALKLLCIGRLIDWKGHDILLDALAQFRRDCLRAVRLTIVYGNGDEKLEALQEQAANLDLTDAVDFVPFVDFSAQPDYLAQFDLYIHPSLYTNDALRKSETFGVAILEAIAAGLPVISSDAGGLPEVVGANNRFARVVPHGDTAALFTALRDMHAEGTAFVDNRAYAEERLQTFSGQRQIDGLRRLIAQIKAPTVSAALFSTSTIQGAGYAAFRLHRGLRGTKVRAQMFTTVRNHENEPDVTVLPHPSGDGTRWRTLQPQAKAGHTIFTVNQTHIPSRDLLRMVEPYDVINLHWHARFLSVENIATLTHCGKPVVMTIRDMMPITGGCHFFHGCENWMSDCRACPQISSAYTDFPAKVLAAKRANYNFDNLTLVTISNHTRGILERSPYFRDCRIETIPNSIETDVFYPYDRSARRREFGLPLDRKIIGYVPSFSSEIKGYRELIAALQLLDPADLGFDPFVMLVGNDTPATAQITHDKKALGYIADNAKLAQAYSCADVVVVPSLEETFSNTTAEAISCGVPVVGFRTGAIPDLAIAGKTGYTAELGNMAELAHGIRTVLTGPSLRANCRAHALETLSFMKQAHAYEALLADLVARNKDHTHTRDPKVFNSFDKLGFGLANIAAEVAQRAKG